MNAAQIYVKTGLWLVLFFYSGLQGLAQNKIGAKFSNIDIKQLCLYNEEGKSPRTNFLTTISKDRSSTTYLWQKDATSTDKYLVYISSIGFEFLDEAPDSEKYFSSEEETAIIQQLFKYKSISIDKDVKGVPTHNFDGDGDGITDLTLTYVTVVSKGRLWVNGNTRKTLYLALPKITLVRKNVKLIMAGLTLEQVCFQNKVRSRLHVKADFDKLVQVKSLKIGGHDLSSHFQTDNSIDILISESVKSVKIQLVDKADYPIEFIMPVEQTNPDGERPNIEILESRVVYILAKENSFFKKMIQLKLQVGPVNPLGLKLETGNIRFTTLNSDVYRPIVSCLMDEQALNNTMFSDGRNLIKMPSDISKEVEMLSRADKISEKQIPFTVEAIEKINDSTFRMTSDSLMLAQGKKLKLKVRDDFAIDRISVNGNKLEQREITIYESNNGQKGSLTLSDRFENKITYPLTILIRDYPQRNPITLESISLLSNYKKYFKTIKTQDPKGKFVWVLDKKLHFLDFTTMDFTTAFAVEFTMNDASNVPDFVFGTNPQSDIHRISIVSDTAFLMEQHSDGTRKLWSKIYPVQAVDKRYKIERRNNFLAEGNAERGDHLLLNGKPFMGFKLSTFNDTKNVRIGFDMSKGDKTFKFNEISLSKHAYVDTIGNKLIKIGLTAKLNQFLNFKLYPTDGVKPVDDKNERSELFNNLQANSYALIICNYNYENEQYAFNKANLPSIRDSLINALKEMQFQQKNIIVRNNLNYDQMRVLFSNIFGVETQSSEGSLQNITDVFPEFPSDGKTRANIYIHYIGHGFARGLAPVNYQGPVDLFPINTWLKKANTGESNLLKNILYVQDACYSSLEGLEHLADADDLSEQIAGYDQNTTGREVILAARNNPTTNFSLTRGISDELLHAGLSAEPLSTRVLFPKLRLLSIEGINFGLFKYPSSANAIGSFIFYPRSVLNPN